MSETEERVLQASQTERIARLESELREARDALRAARFSPLGDNHHNAAECPYCGDPLRAAQAALSAERTARVEAERDRDEQRRAAEWLSGDSPCSPIGILKYKLQASDAARRVMREALEAKASYYQQDAKELKAEASKLSRRGEKEDAAFRFGCADYAAGFAADLRSIAALAAEPGEGPGGVVYCSRCELALVTEKIACGACHAAMREAPATLPPEGHPRAAEVKNEG